MGRVSLSTGVADDAWTSFPAFIMAGLLTADCLLARRRLFLPDTPRGHRAPVLHDSRLNRFEKFSAHRSSHREQHRLVYEKAIAAIGQMITPALDQLPLLLDTDARRQPSKKDPLRLKHPPHLIHHS